MNTAKLMLMPAKPGSCCHCATEHGEYDPHNAWSVFYVMRFWMKFGREPTHADCAAHLPPERQEAYRYALTVIGREWTEPADEPIREPYAAAE